MTQRRSCVGCLQFCRENIHRSHQTQLSNKSFSPFLPPLPLSPSSLPSFPPSLPPLPLLPPSPSSPPSPPSPPSKAHPVLPLKSPGLPSSSVQTRVSGDPGSPPAVFAELKAPPARRTALGQILHAGLGSETHSTPAPLLASSWSSTVSAGSQALAAEGHSAHEVSQSSVLQPSAVQEPCVSFSFPM